MLIITEKSFEVSAIKGYLEKLPFKDFDNTARLDFYNEPSGNAGAKRFETDAKKNFHFDLIIISQKMKTISGLMAAQMIAAKRGIPKPPMVLLTELMDANTITEGAKAGIISYLTVPYNLNNFRDMLTKLVDSLTAKEEKRRLATLKKVKEQGSTVDTSELAKKLNKNGIAELERAKIYAPWNIKPHLAMARLYMEAGDYKTPIPILRNSIKLDFTNKEPHKLLRDCYSKAGMAKEELGTLKKLLTADPKNSELNGKVGDALLREGDFKKAADFFKRSIAMHKPEDSKRVKARAHNGLGTSYLKMDKGGTSGKLQEMAKEQLDHAVTVDPTMITAYFNLIAVYRKMGMEDEARKIMQKAVKISPSNSQDWLDLFFFYIEDKDYKKAKFALSKAVKMEPDNPLTYFLAGEAFMRHRMFVEASENFEKSVEMYPSEVRAYNFLGICYRNRGENAKSIAAYQNALKIDPEDFNVHYNLGRAFINGKDFKNAKTSFETALKLNPELEEAKEGIALASKGR